MPAADLTVLVVDDHPVMLEGLVQIAAQALPDHTVLQASSFAEAQRHALGAHPPDLVLLDPGLPDLAGSPAILGMVRALRGGPVVVVSANDQPQDLETAWASGARAFISKAAQPEDIVSGLQAAAQGQRVLVTRRDGRTPAPPPTAGGDSDLSVRQLEVLAAMCRGLSNKQIAQQLQIAEKTVKAHVTAIFDRLGVANRTQAALAAQRLNVVAEGPPSRPPEAPGG